MSAVFDIESALCAIGFIVRVVDGVSQASGIRVNGVGDIVIQLHRDFYHTGKNDTMAVLSYDGPHMETLYLGAEPKDSMEFSMLFRLLFPLSSISGLIESRFMDKDYNSCFDGIEKYLLYGKERYVPLIYKAENEFCDNSIWIMYAKENVFSFSKRKVLFAIKAGTLRTGLAKFFSRYNELSIQKIIRGREWFGTPPKEIDFLND